MAEDKKSNVWWGVGMVMVFLLVFCIAGYFLVSQYLASNPDQVQNQDNNQQQNTEPPQDPTATWNIVSNGAYGFSFKFPNDFFDQSQPPKLLTGDCNYQAFSSQCPDITKVLAQDQNVSGNYRNTIVASRVVVNGTDYCLTQIADAAAGHTYNYYYYTTVKNQKCLVVYMATSQTRCENYLPLQAGNIQQEKNYNDCVAKNDSQPTTLQQIINTFTFTN